VAENRSQSEREPAQLADGCRTKEQQEQVVAWTEQLRSYGGLLAPQAHFPQLEFRLSRD
jgi:hypothetical protein